MTEWKDLEFGHADTLSIYLSTYLSMCKVNKVYICIVKSKIVFKARNFKPGRKNTVPTILLKFLAFLDSFILYKVLRFFVCWVLNFRKAS